MPLSTIYQLYRCGGLALRGTGPNDVLCSVLLYVREQPRVDNSSAGPHQRELNWEQLVPLHILSIIYDKQKSTCISGNILEKMRVHIIFFQFLP
jgi:hypothetical protein